MVRAAFVHSFCARCWSRSRCVLTSERGGGGPPPFLCVVFPSLLQPKHETKKEGRKKRTKKKGKNKTRKRKRREEVHCSTTQKITIAEIPPPVPWVSVATRSTRDALRAVNLSRGEKHESTFRFEGRARSL